MDLHTIRAPANHRRHPKATEARRRTAVSHCEVAPRSEPHAGPCVALRARSRVPRLLNDDLAPSLSVFDVCLIHVRLLNLSPKVIYTNTSYKMLRRFTTYGYA